MDGVMWPGEVNRRLARSAAVFAHVDRTIEPVVAENIFEERLVRYGFRRETTTTDQNCIGDCVLRAVSRHVYGTDAHQADVRRTGLAALIFYPGIFRRFVENEDWDHYIHRVSRPDEHVDDVFIRAIATGYGLRIIELVPDNHYCIIEYTPFHGRVSADITIATCVHTDAMFDVQD